MERLVDHGDADAIADEDGDGLTAGSQRAEVRSPFGLCLWPEALKMCLGHCYSARMLSLKDVRCSHH